MQVAKRREIPDHLPWGVNAAEFSMSFDEQLLAAEAQCLMSGLPLGQFLWYRDTEVFQELREFIAEVCSYTIQFLPSEYRK